MQDMDRIATDGKDDAVGAPSLALEQVSDLLGEGFVFGR